MILENILFGAFNKIDLETFFEKIDILAKKLGENFLLQSTVIYLYIALSPYMSLSPSAALSEKLSPNFAAKTSIFLNGK